MNDVSANQILTEAVSMNASDIFLVPGSSFAHKINGRMHIKNDIKLIPAAVNRIVKEIYELADNRAMDRVLASGDDDFSFSVVGLARFRVNVFRQRGTLAAVVRVVTFDLPEYRDLNISETVMGIAKLKKGLALVTGPAGSGKSTTLACIIDQINQTRNAHIITLEDPIEYLHRHKKSIVTQREIATDTESYVTALRAALRQVPDVILLGELRDYETMRIAMTAAETGHLVISTLHTIGAANTIDRIVDMFPSNQQQQIRAQLSMVLQVVVSQQLLPALDGSAIPAYEIMFLNYAIRNMIRESRIHQIDSVIYSSQSEGMMTMDVSLLKLFKEGKISRETALQFSSNREALEKRMGWG